MNFEQQGLGVIENPEEADTADTETSVERDSLVVINNRIKKIKDCKVIIANILDVGYGLHANSDDGDLVEKNEKIIARETELVIKEINEQFRLLRDEIIKNGEIKTESRNYSVEYLIQVMNELRASAMEGKSFDVKKMTRTNGLREKVSELTALIVKLKSK